MVDESNAGPVSPAVVVDAEVKAPTAKKRSSSRPRKAPPEPAQPKMRPLNAGDIASKRGARSSG